eukprot:gene12564-13247_t
MRAMLIGRAGRMVRIGRAMIVVRRLGAASRIARGLCPGLGLGRAAFSGIMLQRERIAPGIGPAMPAVVSGCGMLRARIVMPRVARALRGPGLCLGRAAFGGIASRWAWIASGVGPAVSLVVQACEMVHARGASGIDQWREPIAARGGDCPGLCLGRGRWRARDAVMSRCAAPGLSVRVMGRARAAALSRGVSRDPQHCLAR